MRTFGASDTDESVLISLVLQTIPFIHAEHFITKSYARHKALDIFYKEMPEHIDLYTETYIGSGGVFKYSSSFPMSTAETALEAIIVNINAIYNSQSSELKTILDEIKILCQQTKYRLTLN